MELRRALAIFRRRLVLVVVLVIVGLGGAYLGSSRGSTYQAETTVYVGQRSTLDPSIAAAQSVLAETFTLIFPSGHLAQEAVDRTHLARRAGAVAAHTTARVFPGTSLIRIAVTDRDPVAAAALANATAQALVDVTRQVAPLVENPQAAFGSANGTTTTTPPTPLTTVPKAKGSAKAATTPTVPATTTTTVAPAVTTNRAPTTIAQPASVPAAPLHTNTRRNVGLGGLAGLVVGAAVILLVDYLGLHARSARELESDFGLPVLGVIPRQPHAASLPGESDHHE